MVSHEGEKKETKTRRRATKGGTHLKYVADNEQAKEGKVLRLDLHAARQATERQVRRSAKKTVTQVT